MLEEMCSSMKIIVVGNGKVGKTTLTIKYVKGKFTTEYKKNFRSRFFKYKKIYKVNRKRNRILHLGYSRTRLL